jgi:uncharacterized protein
MSATEATPPSTPLVDQERAGVLDALRGFALLGILISHVPDFSGYNFLTPFAQANLDTFGLDRPLATIFEFVIKDKFYSLFSLLFGIGFAVQLDSAAQRGTNFARHFGRRLAVLLIIGLAHASLWYGDILKDYALIGLLLIPTARWKTVTVAWATAAILTLRILWPSLMAVAVSGSDHQPTATDPGGTFSRLTESFYGSDLMAMLAANAQLLTLKALQMVYAGKAVSILGMFLVGTLIGKLRLYRDLITHAGLFKRVLWLCAPVGVLGNIALVHLHATTPDFPPTPAWVLEQSLAALAVPALTLTYAAGFALVWGHSRILRALAPVGQTALTTYVSQTLICITLFYGIGLGFGGRIGLAGGAALSLLIFALQVLVSTLWLRHFRYGPLEWLWRRGTYGVPIAFRRT